MVRPAMLGLAALAFLVRAAYAGDFSLALDYDVRWGPFRILSMELTSEVAGDRYQATSVLETRGTIGLLFPWRSRAESSGRRDGPALRPERHRADGTYRSERRTVDIEYRRDGAVSASITPPPEEDVRVPDELQRETVDPLTAGMLAVEDGCRGRVPVFDGRRRYDLRLEELAPGTVPESKGALYAGSARRCRAVVEARAGFWRFDPRDDSEPTILDFWIASPRGGMPPVPVYLELTGARGTLAIVLTKADEAAANPVS